MMPARMTPAAMREDDGQGVDPHDPADEERLQQVGLDLLHPDDDAEHDQRLERPQGDEREQHGDRARHGRTDDGDERAEEDEQRDAGGEGHPEDGGPDADAGGVDGGDDEGRAGEGGELRPGDQAGGVHLLARRLAGRAAPPSPR